MIFPPKMTFAALSFLLLCPPDLTVASGMSSITPFMRRATSSSSRDVPSQGYYNPLNNGGSMLDQVPGTTPPGLGEPLNTIISGASDAAVLVDAQTNGGLRNYFLALGFAGECLGQHQGALQSANLGDGNGYLNETAVIRWDYGDPQLGTCKETIEGGNHFRYWTQNGAAANSGAIFMAVSYEMPLVNGHDIVVNGYNLGRDWLVGNATQTIVPTANLTTSPNFTGSISSGGYTYKTSVNYVSGLLQNTSVGVNHNTTVGVNGANAIDGLVAVLTVTITQKPSNATTSAAWIPSPHPWTLPLALISFSLAFLYAL